ncbi:unnamed protein product [Spodoptera littoralis]|uniref:Phospholipid scramblase n=1 Tax=Spodoptera littoralis TaxID=7109 RepID=A0A9P0N8T5_SPOLI|nr:unnamed protein product [Spodoptera littoralis]CAH1643986.1 unnamed protein product [Spodoptera littoralis]
MNVKSNYVEVKPRRPWMECPQLPDDSDNDPGLAFIYNLDQLIVTEQRDGLHDIIGNEGIAYTIFNSVGQKVFLAVLNKKFRNFNIKIFNNYGNEVINVEKPFTWWTNKVLVWAPPGNFVGSVQERSKCILNKYTVRNQVGTKILKIRSEGFGRYVYKVYLVSTRYAIGVVREQSPAGYIRKTKNFGVSFPAEMNVYDKAVLLGACFLIGLYKY